MSYRRSAMFGFWRQQVMVMQPLSSNNEAPPPRAGHQDKTNQMIISNSYLRCRAKGCPIDQFEINSDSSYSMQLSLACTQHSSAFSPRVTFGRGYIAHQSQVHEVYSMRAGLHRHGCTTSIRSARLTNRADHPLVWPLRVAEIETRARRRDRGGPRQRALVSVRSSG
jgi:hypothetical protein